MASDNLPVKPAGCDFLPCLIFFNPEASAGALFEEIQLN
jgi:hypothetical protein